MVEEDMPRLGLRRSATRREVRRNNTHLKAVVAQRNRTSFYEISARWGGGACGILACGQR